MNKIRLNKHGASLAETLVTVLLLVIVLSAVTAGVHAMVNSYFEIRKKADAESLLMTAAEVVRGDLRNATGIVAMGTEENPDFSSSNSFYCESRYSVVSYDQDGNKTVVEYADGTEKPLVTDKTLTEDLYTDVEGLSFIPDSDYKTTKSGCFTVTLRVLAKDGSADSLAEEVINVRPYGPVNPIIGN